VLTLAQYEDGIRDDYCARHAVTKAEYMRDHYEQHIAKLEADLEAKARTIEELNAVIEKMNELHDAPGILSAIARANLRDE